jgi:predicted amidohydrolase YtcJ
METIPGFVDHHTHLLAKSAGEDLPADLRSYHENMARQGLNPMDMPRDANSPSYEQHFADALQEAANAGLRQVTETGMRNWKYWNALCHLRERDQIPLRVRIFVGSGIAVLNRMKHTDDNLLEIEGVKFYADGWLGTHTCGLSEPFADESDNYGVSFLDAETLARRAQPIAEAGFRIATHAIGDRAIKYALDAYEMVYGSDCSKQAPRIEHAQVLNPELIERIAHMGVVCCIQPSFGVSDSKFAEKHLGNDRMQHAYNWQSLVDSGVKIIAGSDFPIETLDPLLGLHRLTTGQDEQGNHVARPLSLDAALRAMTDNSLGITTLSAPIETIATDDWRELKIL